MAIEKKEVEIAEELNDVMILVKEIVKVIKEKGDYASLIDELVAAVNGIDEIPAEFKENMEAFINTALINSVAIAMLFVKKDEEAEA